MYSYNLELWAQTLIIRNKGSRVLKPTVFFMVAKFMTESMRGAYQ